MPPKKKPAGRRAPAAISPPDASRTVAFGQGSPKRKVIANVTSKMGSVADNTSGGCYSYRSTKSALNMVTKSMSLDLAGRGICAVVLHPGWVKTDMGGMGANLEPVDSISGMRKVIDGLSPDDGGRFFNYDGAEIPW